MRDDENPSARPDEPEATPPEMRKPETITGPGVMFDPEPVDRG